MKLFLAFLLILLSLSSIHGQQVKQFTARTTKTHDTLSGVDTISNVLPVTGTYQSVTVQVVLTKLAGTAAGTLYLEKSLDGTNYSHLDSVQWTNQTINSFIYSYTPYPYQYLRVKEKGVSGDTVTVKGYYLLRPIIPLR